MNDHHEIDRIQECFDLEGIETPEIQNKPVSGQSVQPDGAPRAIIPMVPLPRFRHHAAPVAAKARAETIAALQAENAALKLEIIQCEKAEKDFTDLINDLAKAPVTAITEPRFQMLLHQADDEATTYQNQALTAQAEKRALHAEIDQMRAEMDDLHDLLEIAQDRSADRDDLEHELQEERNKVYQLTHANGQPTATLKPAALDRITLAHYRAIYGRMSPEERDTLPVLMHDLAEPEWYKRSAEWQGRVLSDGGVGQTPYEASEETAIAAGKKRTAWGQGAIQPIEGGKKDPKSAA